MTNKQLKQKAIQEAYGEYWEALKEFIDKNGWLTELKTSFTTEVMKTQ